MIVDRFVFHPSIILNIIFDFLKSHNTLPSAPRLFSLPHFKNHQIVTDLSDLALILKERTNKNGKNVERK